MSVMRNNKTTFRRVKAQLINLNKLHVGSVVAKWLGMSGFKSLLGNWGIISKKDEERANEEDLVEERRASKVDVVFE